MKKKKKKKKLPHTTSKILSTLFGLVVTSDSPSAFGVPRTRRHASRSDANDREGRILPSRKMRPARIAHLTCKDRRTELRRYILVIPPRDRKVPVLTRNSSPRIYVYVYIRVFIRRCGTREEVSWHSQPASQRTGRDRERRASECRESSP